ncbi:MAG: MFS transporter, partial [Candidatus Hydrogenedentes bacterium]|nr:MFS transporter [Candidatus Hydrogenedentota bacterium]
MSESMPVSPPGRARWLVPAALLVSVLIGDLDRLNIALALPAIGRDFGWTAEEIGRHGGTLISIFFIGYGIANIFLSPLAARFGPRRSLMLIVVLFSCFTMLGAPLSYAVLPFACTRFSLGLGEGVHFPMMSTVTKHWFPAHERSRANGIWVSGVMLSTILAPVIIVPLINAFGWRFMLVALGVLGMAVTLPVLWYFVYDTPAKSPRVSAAERDYILSNIEPEVDEHNWRFLAKPVFYVALLAGVLNNFCAFGIIMWLPTYFTEGKHLPFESLSYAASLPYAIGFTGLAVSAFLGDWLQRRALLAGVGFLLAACLLYIATLAATLPAIILAFAAAVFFQTFYTAQEWAILQRILPHKSISQGAGVYNGTAMLVGGGAGTAIIGSAVSATG